MGASSGNIILGILPDTLALLRVATEALRCSAIGAVIIEGHGVMKELNLTASRRLMLSAETSGVTAFVLHSGTAAHPSAAHTRWRVKAAPSMALPGYAPGKPVFNVELLRQRPGKGNAVFITIEDGTGIINALLWASELERQRRAVMSAPLMLIDGFIQRSEEGAAIRGYRSNQSAHWGIAIVG